ncbi:MAG: hypothetical protein QNJ47_07355 [Nostocaceae cyanobacterium]|nr:hypothetical protein [Nostocaceae cyanobacterium]
MTKGYKPKKLIVEGEQDKRVIPEFIEANGITWEDEKGNPIVYIEPNGNNQIRNLVEKNVPDVKFYVWNKGCS